MKREPFVEIASLIEQPSLYSEEELDEFLPQTGAMRHIHRIVKYEPDDVMVGVKEVSNDEFWVSGHFPGWAVLPGIIMLEAMGQVCAVFWHQTFDAGDRIIMFAGLDKVKFRGAVFPGETIYVIAKKSKLHMRMSKFDCQVVKEGTIVCEAYVTGVLGPKIEAAKKQASV